MSVGRPLFLQNITNYTADEFRTLLDAVSAQSGVVRDGCAVQPSSPIGMSVQVLTGFVVVAAKSTSNGKYLVEVTAPDPVTVPAASTFTRTDQIVTEVLDTSFGDPSDIGHNICVAGLSTGPAALTPNQTLLATVTVAPGQSSVTAGNIADKRRPSTPAPYGYINRAVGPATQTDAGVAYQDIVIVTAPVTINRRYRVTAGYNGIQINAGATTTRSQVIDDQGGQQYVANISGIGTGQVMIGTGVLFLTATSTRTATFRLQALSSGGAIRSGVNTCNVTVEDIGTA
jgi:hypothetical protein